MNSFHNFDAKCVSLAGKEKVRAVFSWNLSSVRRRYERKSGLTRQRCKSIETEYRKYLSLIILHPDKAYGASGPVDDFWHEHIVDTVDYNRMCLHITGQFIHHIPVDLDRRGAKTPDTYREHTLKDLPKYFKSLNRSVWPIDEDAHALCNDRVSSATC